MTVFFNCIKRIFRNKAQIVVMLVLPFLPLILIVSGTAGTDMEFKVGVVDLDNTRLTSELKRNLETKCRVIPIERDEIESGLASSSISYAIVVDKGYTERLIGGKNPQIKGYAKKEADISKLIGSYIDSYMNPAKNIANAVNGSSERFYKALGVYNNGSMVLKQEKVRRNDKDRANIVWGMVIMFMMFSSTYAASQLQTDRKNRTLFRSVTAPVGIRSYMVQSILSYLVVSVLQISILVPVIVYVMGAYAGNSALAIYLLLLFFSLVTVSLGVAISSLTKSVITGSALGVGITVGSCMLAGAWGGFSMSGLADSIAKITPPYWAVHGIRKLLDGGSLTEITNNIAILLLFSIIFFLLGTWKKADIMK